MGELKEIKDFLQQVTDAFAAVLDVELAIIDRNLEAIAGTGPYKKEVGFVYHQSSTSSRMMQNAKDSCLFIKNTSNSEYCKQCSRYSNCDVCAFSMCSISYRGRKVGTISLLALNEHQRKVLLDDYVHLMNFLYKISNFIVTTLNEKEMRSQITMLANQFETVINSVHEGIIALDQLGRIVNVNKPGMQLLGLVEDVRGEKVEDLFPDFNPWNFLNTTKSDKNYFVQELNYQLPDESNREITLFCIITYIQEGNKIIGAVLSLQLKEEVKEIVSSVIADSQGQPFDKLIGVSDEFTALKQQLEKVARTDSTVLINGETGTGKSMIVNALHEASDRQRSPLITLNCAAIPESLLESELFGYEEGAFTGARKGGKPGKFELAHQGTLFLDEIGDMPLSFQVELLQALETGKIERVGGVNSHQVDVRIVAATNQNLEELMDRGLFRKDLFFRLNVIPVTVPPLRERKEDITLLMHHFLDLITKKLNKKITAFDDDVRFLFCNYNWPGNVRELRNIIEYAINIETSRRIRLVSLPDRFIKGNNHSSQDVFNLEFLERNTVQGALQRFGWDTGGKEKAAQALGISRATLYRKIKHLKLDSQNDNSVSR